MPDPVSPERNAGIGANPEPAEIMLRAAGLNFSWHEDGKHPVFQGIDFQVNKGSLTILLGDSGCGKSTLCYVLAGLLPESGGNLLAGTVYLRNSEGGFVDLASLDVPQRAARIGVVFQNADLQFCMRTLRDEIYFALENLHVKPQKMADLAQEAAAAVGAEPFLDRDLWTLSGGEKQRCQLATLIAAGCEFWILDEPFANLDRHSISELQELLAMLREEMGLTVLAVDHRPQNWFSRSATFRLMHTNGELLPQAFCEQDEEVQRRAALRRKRSENKNLSGKEVLTLKNFSLPRLPDGFEARYGRKKSVYAKYWPAEIKEDGLGCGFLLCDVNLRLGAGQIGAVLGPSGSGKSSLLRAFLREYIYAGEVNLAGRNLRHRKRRELGRNVGMVFQNPANQFVTQVVLDEVLFSLRLWYNHMSEEDLKQTARRLLAQFGLHGTEKRPPYSLSQGQQRRLAVLCVLSGRQQLLLLDEPTYGQDDRSVVAIMTLLRRQTVEQNLAVLLVTHDEELACQEADLVWRIEKERMRLCQEP